MSLFCLTPQAEKAIKEKFLSGELDFEKISNAKTSEERRALFSFLGDGTALKLNEALETRLLRPNQQRAMSTFFQQALGVKEPARRDILTQVLKQERLLNPKELESFMADAMAAKYGHKTTQEQAKHLFELAKVSNDKLSAIKEESPIGSPERLEQGAARVAFVKYRSQLEQESNKIPLKELITNPIELFTQLSGLSKSFVASMNNHFFGRQGWRTLFDKPKIWTDNFMKSWSDAGKEIQGISAMDAIKADVWSRPNSLNGLYAIHKIDVKLDKEEQIPSHAPTRIPLLGRLFSASNSMFEGASLRIRADFADAVFKEAQENGVDVRDPKTNLGTLVNSITARGQVDTRGKFGQLVNAAIFSPKYLKSQLDLMGAIPDYLINKTPLGEGKETGEFARAVHARNALKTIVGISTILAVAKLLDPDSVELDPRSSRSGKIWVGADHEIGIDVTAGNASLWTLAARLTPSMHNGEWGLWSENQSGKWTNNSPLAHTKHNPAELITGFLEQRTAPLTSYILSYIDKKYWDKESDAGKALKLVSPMNAQAISELNKDSEKINNVLYTFLVSAGFLGTHIAPDFQHRKEE
jgi:hypothetical protein